MTIVKRRRGWKVVIGGDPHQGWLPAGAATPPAEPIREVELDIYIESDPAGYLLVYTTTDGSVHGDTWHPTLEEAESAAAEWFGLKKTDWELGESHEHDEVVRLLR